MTISDPNQRNKRNASIIEVGTKLVQPLFAGPLDLVGDVHGEIDALTELLATLGYNASGRHPDGRRLVFLGDLVDRGPDTPAVLDLIMPMVHSGRAQCVLGNHELNLLRGKDMRYSAWFHGNPERFSEVDGQMPQRLLDPSRRDEVLDFFRGLPVVLEREDLRVVHACWDDDAVEGLRGKTNALSCYRRFCSDSYLRISQEAITDPVEQSLLQQNENPIKLLTSGPECRALTPWKLDGELRYVQRDPWWDDYAGPMCVFGHYSRVQVKAKGDSFFDQTKLYEPLGQGNTMCIDYSAGSRWQERNLGRTTGGIAGHLAALRWADPNAWKITRAEVFQPKPVFV